jgi:hypothetical protein
MKTQAGGIAAVEKNLHSKKEANAIMKPTQHKSKKLK